MTIPAWLPRDGEAREALREKGQFWTPDWVADAMVAYALDGRSLELFDPAVGEGAFFRAARRMERSVALRGTELDPEALIKAKASGLSAADLSGVMIRDFILDRPQGPFPAIVANPPYIRHHRLSTQTKQFVRGEAERIVGAPIDGRAGLHVYFLIWALDVLADNGRLSFIMPADTAEGVFAPRLWSWIQETFRIDGVITFDASASPFPGVDTNPLVFLISRKAPNSTLAWAKVRSAGTSELVELVRSGFAAQTWITLTVIHRDTGEALAEGLSRPPHQDDDDGSARLLDLATVKRGIATGANSYFLMTDRQRRERRLAERFFTRVIGKTRSVPGDQLTDADLARLEAEDVPTWMLNIQNSDPNDLPDPVARYLAEGVASGLPGRALIAMRKPWYRVERRDSPPILFAYLGRRNARFIRNRTDAVPLTGFLCVYPRDRRASSVDKLLEALNDRRTLGGLRRVGKSYGSGAVKVEPRALERLPVPATVLAEYELAAQQTSFGFGED